MNYWRKKLNVDKNQQRTVFFFSKIDLHNFLVGKNVGNGLNNELNQILNGLLY